MGQNGSERRGGDKGGEDRGLGWKVEGVGKEESDKEDEASRRKGQWRGEDTLLVDGKAVGSRKRQELE